MKGSNTPETHIETVIENKVKPVKSVVYGLLISIVLSTLVSFLVALVYGALSGADTSNESSSLSVLSENISYLVTDLILSALVFYYAGSVAGKLAPGKENIFGIILAALTTSFYVLLFAWSDSFWMYPIWYGAIAFLSGVTAILLGANPKVRVFTPRISDTAEPLPSSESQASSVKGQNMTTQQVAAIALRLFAIWLLIRIVLGVPGIIQQYLIVEQIQQLDNQKAFYIGVLCLFLVIGFIAVYLINKASNSVLSSTEAKSEATISEDSQRIIFQLVGLYFVVGAFAQLPGLVMVILSANIKMTVSGMMWQAGPVVPLLMGLWLISKSAFWVNLFSQLRRRA
ncbi:MAG: hypothetical protein JKX97_09355 [Candidatus Lindowbacteria bacterium]|nr:hypothetical protein [Candidatus Lindowbacteria bacterium]